MEIQLNIGGDSNHIAISRDGPRLIIEELEPHETFFTKFVSILFSLPFIAFGLFITIWDLDTASEPLRYPATALFCAFGLGILWLSLRRLKSLRCIKLDKQSRSVEYGKNILGNNDQWRYVKKGTFPYNKNDKLYLGYIDHTEMNAEATYSGLYTEAQDAPRQSLLLMGAAYELEMAIEQIREHMAALPEPVLSIRTPERRRFGRRMR